MPRATALLTMFALVLGSGAGGGCFGYNRGAKRWSYVGDALLIAGGGAAIGVEETSKPADCTGPGCPSYTPPFRGGLVVGAVLVVAGVAGLVINATRTTVKTSR